MVIHTPLGQYTHTYMCEWTTVFRNPPVATSSSIHPDGKTKWEVQGFLRLLLYDILIAELLLSPMNFLCVLAGGMPNTAGYLCSSSASRDKGIYTTLTKMGRDIRYGGDEMWVKYGELFDHRWFQLPSSCSFILREFLLVPAPSVHWPEWSNLFVSLWLFCPHW